MTRLAQVKAERDEAKRKEWAAYMALNLALTSKPDYQEAVKEPDGAGRYRISAYGLSRADGGYYGMGVTNIDVAMGIRYGVIHANDVGQSWFDDAEAEYGPPYCPKCGNEADKPEAFGDTFKVNGDINVYEFDGADDYSDEHYEGRDYVCEKCLHFFGSESAFSDDPIGFYYTGEGYAAQQTDTDIFVTRSPFYTYARFCSPCAPGACDLSSPMEPGLNQGNNRAYCFGHNWFEDGKAPYRVFRVSDDSEVFPDPTA